MIIQMSIKELNCLKAFLKELNNPMAVEEFNNIFASDRNGNVVGIKGRKNPVNENQILLTIPEEVYFKLFSILIKNGYDIREMIKHDRNVTKIPKWLSLVTKIGKELCSIFTGR